MKLLEKYVDGWGSHNKTSILSTLTSDCFASDRTSLSRIFLGEALDYRVIVRE